ncbi:target of Nesh-SH3 isoform X48 [Engystomops pustulosus]|uniref:target of Nesh-SH3 isoform X48 n=1 Tax=Engystomops pustulosus TaxID=76066 RepID=UPI003AFA0D83
MISRLFLLFFCGIILADLENAQKLPKVKKLNMKAHINITGDTLIMKFHRPNQNIKLEGFILGYGSNYFSNQYIPWPDNGKSYITDVDAETRYLIAVKPNDNSKKSCKEKNSIQKPLQLVIGTLTPTSVFLSWGILINPQVDWSALTKCPNDRFYTVRYREKNKDWNFQLCPTTETVIENLKPSTLYEFGVKDNSDDEIWSKSQTHKTNSKGKENGHLENSYKIPKGTLQYATEDTKAFIPVTKVKQGFQNITKSTPAPPPTDKSAVYRDEIKKPYVATTTTRIATPKPKPVSKITEPPPVSKTTEKPPVEDPKPVASQPVVDSFTPDSSTGTLEWVRATMVTNIPLESSTTDERTAPLVVVRESYDVQAESSVIATLEPVHTVDLPRDILVSPIIIPIPYSKELTPQKPESVLVNERLATNVPQERIISAETTPVLQQTTMLPLRTYSTAYEEHPVATDVPLVIPLFHSKIYLTTLAADEKQPFYVPTKMPSLEKSETKYATTRKYVPNRQSTLPTPLRTKPALGDNHVHSTYESIARTEVPQSVSARFDISSATMTEKRPAKQRTWPPRTPKKTTTASIEGQQIYTTFESMTRTDVPLSVSAFTGGVHTATTQSSIVRTEAPYIIRVPNKTASFQPKPLPSTEAPNEEADSTEPESEINTTEATHTSEPETFTLASHDKTVVQKNLSSSTPKTTTVHKTTSRPFTIFTSTTSQRTQPTQASKKRTVSPVQHKTPLPEKTHPTAVLKDIHSTQLIEEATTSTAQNETQKLIPKKVQTTESPSLPADPKTSHSLPTDGFGVDIFELPKIPLEPNKTEQSSPPKFNKTTKSLKISTVVKPVHNKRMPINIIALQIFPDPTIPSEQTATTSSPSLKTTRSNKMLYSKPAPYRLQHSSSRPKTSLRPRTRPPGGKVYDNTKLLGVSRNISMEQNNTGKRTFLVSSPPLPPVKPTSLRRRIHPTNVTGRPGVSVSTPPLLPVRPTSIRRKAPSTNVTGRPGNPGDILIPRAPSATKPDCAVVCIKSPMKQPTLPSQEEDFVLSTVFSPSPKSDVDALGKTRYTSPHVVYMSKNDSVPCSITDTLKHFPTGEENTNPDVTSAPQNPPTNLTVVTVEGCSSFVVLNWEKPDNDTVTEYDVISKENGGPPGKDQSIITTNQTHSTVENLKPDTSYEFQVIPKNPLGEGPSSSTVEFNTESADPRVSEPVSGGKDAIWTEIKFKADSYSECKGKQYVKRTWYKKFVGIQLCNSLRYKIYLSDKLLGTFYNIGDQSGFGEDHCQFVDSFLEGRTGEQIQPNALESKEGFYRSVRQQPVEFGAIGGQTHISYVHWYECGISIPGKW